MMTRFEVWLVPNGRLADFRRGMTGHGYPDACQMWGAFDTLEEVREKYAELAAENFDREGGEGENYDDDERDKALADAVARARDSLSIEWQGDLKWVLTREVRELDNGDIEFVGIV